MSLRLGNGMPCGRAQTDQEQGVARRRSPMTVGAVVLTRGQGSGIASAVKTVVRDTVLG
jgi:hypothetical protein